MKKIILILCLIAGIVGKPGAQTKAITEQGDTVILYANGKWHYAKEVAMNDTGKNLDTIAENKKIYLKNAQAITLKKSARVDVGIYFDNTKWGFTKGGIDDEAEFILDYKDKQVEARFISEPTPIDLDVMSDAVLMNLQKISPDAEMLSKEYSTVNGLKVLCLRTKATVKKMEANYLFYIYSDKTGTIQFATYAIGQKTFDSYYKIMETLLNGLVLAPKK